MTCAAVRVQIVAAVAAPVVRQRESVGQLLVGPFRPLQHLRRKPASGLSSWRPAIMASPIIVRYGPACCRVRHHYLATAAGIRSRRAAQGAMSPRRVSVAIGPSTGALSGLRTRIRSRGAGRAGQASIASGPPFSNRNQIQSRPHAFMVATYHRNRLCEEQDLVLVGPAEEILNNAVAVVHSCIKQAQFDTVGVNGVVIKERADKPIRG